MKAPTDVRPWTSAACTLLKTARCSAHAFRMRRAQIVLTRARGHSAKPIAQLVGSAVQSVRNVIPALNTKARDVLIQPSNRPKKAQPTLDATKRARLQHILHQSPRTFGKPTGLWTLALAAQVCWEPGVSQRCGSDATMRRALKQRGPNGKRANY